ncbi:MAG: hypothetical protein IJ111_07630 [Eggerthellaceae bacterium]|nr:hypothetical protein [Eggerthellaceae bacterium]
MSKIAKFAIGIAVGSAVCCLVVHRNVVKAMIKGEPLPEPPEWHKAWHPFLSK